jgi:hypothetical protein
MTLLNVINMLDNSVLLLEKKTAMVRLTTPETKDLKCSGPVTGVPLVDRIDEYTGYLRYNVDKINKIVEALAVASEQGLCQN